MSDKALLESIDKKLDSILEVIKNDKEDVKNELISLIDKLVERYSEDPELERKLQFGLEYNKALFDLLNIIITRSHPTPIREIEPDNAERIKCYKKYFDEKNKKVETQIGSGKFP